MEQNYVKMIMDVIFAVMYLISITEQINLIILIYIEKQLIIIFKNLVEKNRKRKNLCFIKSVDLETQILKGVSLFFQSRLLTTRYIHFLGVYH